MCYAGQKLPHLDTGKSKAPWPASSKALVKVVHTLPSHWWVLLMAAKYQKSEDKQSGNNKITCSGRNLLSLAVRCNDLEAT